MKKFILIQLLICLSAVAALGQQIQGVIYYQNSGSKTADGIEVSAFGCNGTYSKNGMFILPCTGKKAGQKVKLIIGSKDAQGKGIEVVNAKELEWFRMPDSGNDAPIEIIVCYAGDRDKAALRYYGILIKANNKEYEARLASLEAALETTTLDATERRTLIEQIDELRKQRDEALEKMEEQAIFIASINQDKASDLVKIAIQTIEQEEDINAALSILDDAKLEEAYQLALDKKVKAEAEIKQVIEGYALKIKILLSKFRYSEATSCYEKIIEIHEANHFAKEELAIWYKRAAITNSRLHKFEKSLECSQKAIGILEEVLDPGDSSLLVAYFDIGTTYRLLGQKEKALEYQQKVIVIQEETLGPENHSLGDSYSLIALTYAELGLCKEALEYQEKANAIYVLYPKNPVLAYLYNNTGNTYRCLKQYEKALEYHQKGIAILTETLNPKNPDWVYFYNDISATYFYLEQYEKALEYHQKGIAIGEEVLEPKHPILARSYLNFAITLRELKQYDRAIIYLDKCIEIVNVTLPESHPYQRQAKDTWKQNYYLKAKREFDNKDYENALEVLDTLNREVDYFLSWNLEGVCYYYLKNYPKSIESHQKALEINPEYKENYYFNNIGMSYAKNNQFEEAQFAFTEYEKLYPNEGKTYRNWAMYYALQEDKEKALQFLLKAVELGYDDIEWLQSDNSMDSLREHKAFKQIIEQLEKGKNK